MSYNSVLATEDLSDHIPACPLPAGPWGEVNYWEVPLPGIYQLCLKDSEEIYVVDKENNGGVIPPSVYKYGIDAQDDKYAWFTFEYGLHVIEYLILTTQLNRTNDQCEKTAIERQLNELFVYGTITCPDFFGAWSPSDITPRGPLQRYTIIANGVAFVYSNGGCMLSISRTFCEECDYISKTTLSLARNSPPAPNVLLEEEYYWDIDKCAPLVFDLLTANVKPMMDYITSMDDLMYHLCEYYPDYVKTNNDTLDRLIGNLQQNGRDSSALEAKRITKPENASVAFLKLP